MYSFNVFFFLFYSEGKLRPKVSTVDATKYFFGYGPSFSLTSSLSSTLADARPQLEPWRSGLP